MTDMLNPNYELHQKIIDYRLRCLELAIQMIGPRPYPPSNPDESFTDPYFRVAAIISEHARIIPPPDEEMKKYLEAAKERLRKIPDEP